MLVVITCAIVLPIQNLVLMPGDTIRYKDNGDHIVTEDDIPQFAYNLITTKQGTGPRFGCGKTTDFSRS